MPRSSAFLFLVLAALLAWWSLSAGAAPDTSPVAVNKAVLPGARPEIDASQYPSLQAAIDALPPEGGLVRLPPGQFEITEPLVVTRSDTRIEGAGGATHIKNTNAAGKPALLIRHADGEKVKAADKLWRIALSNFRITGNEKSGTGIEATMVNEVFIQGVTVSYHGGDGIRLDRCYEDPRVSDCLITYNKRTGLDLPGCHDIVVCGNQFEENRDALHIFDGFNLCMTGNCVDDHLGDGVVIENTYGSVLSGNMIEECDGRAIVLARDCYGITISANVIAHNGGGVDLVDAHGCAVSANTFVLLKAPPKAKDGTQPSPLNLGCVRISPESGRIAVTGNNFCDSFIGEGTRMRKVDDQLAGGLILQGTRFISVTGNTFTGMPKAVELRAPASEHILFQSNVQGETTTESERLPNPLGNIHVPGR